MRPAGGRAVGHRCRRCWVTQPQITSKSSSRAVRPSATGAARPAAKPSGSHAGTVRYGTPRAWRSVEADGQLCHRGIYDAYLLARRWPQHQQQSVADGITVSGRDAAAAAAAQYFDRRAARGGRPPDATGSSRRRRAVRPSDRPSRLSQCCVVDSSRAPMLSEAFYESSSSTF